MTIWLHQQQQNGGGGRPFILPRRCPRLEVSDSSTVRPFPVPPAWVPTLEALVHAGAIKLEAVAKQLAPELEPPTPPPSPTPPPQPSHEDPTHSAQVSSDGGTSMNEGGYGDFGMFNDPPWPPVGAPLPPCFVSVATPVCSGATDDGQQVVKLQELPFAQAMATVAAQVTPVSPKAPPAHPEASLAAYDGDFHGGGWNLLGERWLSAVPTPLQLHHDGAPRRTLPLARPTVVAVASHS